MESLSLSDLDPGDSLNPAPHPKETRAVAVRRIRDGESVRSVAGAMRISERTLRRWMVDDEVEMLLHQGRELRGQIEETMAFLRDHPEALRKPPRDA